MKESAIRGQRLPGCAVRLRVPAFADQARPAAGVGGGALPAFVRPDSGQPLTFEDFHESACCYPFRAGAVGFLG